MSANSSSCQPTPTPRMLRPPESRSSVAPSLAKEAGGGGEQGVVDAHGAVEAEVRGAPEIGAHLAEHRGLRAEGEAREPEAEFHRKPSSFFASPAVRPPTRGGGGPPRA